MTDRTMTEADLEFAYQHAYYYAHTIAHADHDTSDAYARWERDAVRDADTLEYGDHSRDFPAWVATHCDEFGSVI